MGAEVVEPLMQRCTVAVGSHVAGTSSEGASVHGLSFLEDVSASRCSAPPQICEGNSLGQCDSPLAFMGFIIIFKITYLFV